VLDRSLEYPLHLPDLVALFRRRARRRGLPRRGAGRGRHRSCHDHRCQRFHHVPLLPPRLLSLRRTIEQIHLVDLLPVFHDLDADVVLHDAERAVDLHQIRLALRVDVAQQFRDPERELALLPLLALLDEARTRRVTSASDAEVRRTRCASRPRRLVARISSSIETRAR
jgi:hypothetical protein